MNKKELQKRYNEIVLNTNGGVDDYVVSLCQIANAINELDDTDDRIEELEQQLKELPKKICDEIEKLGNQGDFIEISHSKLNEIIEKYTKEQENERD